MTIKTRWFGKRIEGEFLKNLVNALGEDSEKLLKTSDKDKVTLNSHGRVKFIPGKQGVNVDLYVFRTDYLKNEISNPNILLSPSDDFDSFSSGDFYANVDLNEKHIQGEIKYQNVS